MFLSSKVLGELEVEESSTLYLPDGLLGFEDLKRYILLESEDFLPFLWLISVEQPEIGFAIADPQLFYGPPFEVALSESDKDVLDYQAEDPVSVFVIVSIADGGRKITANLKGPVVLNTRNRLGKQVVVYSSLYSVRQGLLSREEERVPVAGVAARGRTAAQG
jgi:flagellar assembly factor FliW